MNDDKDQEESFHDRNEGVLVVFDDFGVAKETLGGGEVVDDEVDDEDDDDEDAAANFKEPEPGSFGGFGGGIHFFATNDAEHSVTRI